jgi:hypothetical protein
MGSGRTAGERVFEAYLEAHGYPEPEHEPDLDIPKRPDYLVRRDEVECVCEVKEFNPDEIDSPFHGSGGTTSPTEVLKPIRAKIRAAAKQLKPLADRDPPLAVVLTNPHGAFVPMGEQEIVWAMYGDPVYTMAISTETGAAVGEGRHTTGKHGKLSNDHPYISAIVVIGERRNAADFYEEQAKHSTAETNEERWGEVLGAADRGEVPEGSYYRADCFKTMSPEATPLPNALFDGPNDRLLEVDLEQGAYVQVRGREFTQ